MHDAAIFISRFLIFAAVHSLLAIPRVKRYLTGRVQSGHRLYRLIYNLTSLAMFGWVMASYRNTPVIYVVPGAWSLAMYLIQGILLAALVCCVSQTGAADFLGLPRKDAASGSSDRLVTGGCYGVVRHPLYLISMLFLLFNPVITTRWLILSALSSIYFIIGAMVEERRLLAEHGEQYQAYQQTVPFMIPGMSVLRRVPASRNPKSSL